MEFTQYALNDRGEITSINAPDVQRGLQCNCTCPCCGSAMVARKGDVRRHHFAHHSEQLRECHFAFETELHILAKLLIEQEKRICLPVSFSKAGEHQVCEIFPVSNVRIEQFHQGRKPDLIVDIDGYDYVIEIAVTHFCDTPKIQDYRRKYISAVEFRLSSLRGEDDLEAALRKILFTDSTEHAHWVSLHPMNDIGQKAMQLLRAEAENLKSIIKSEKKKESDLKDGIRTLKSSIRNFEREHYRLSELVGALTGLKAINNEIFNQNYRLAEIRTLYADEGKAVQHFVEREAKLDEQYNKIQAEKVRLSDESNKIAKRRSVLNEDSKRHKEEVNAQWAFILNALHEIANIENDLRLEGLDIGELDKLTERIRHQADYEDLYKRRCKVIEAELRKQEEKQARIQSDISELLKQKDFYQAEVARLSREVNSCK